VACTLQNAARSKAARSHPRETNRRDAETPCQNRER